MNWRIFVWLFQSISLTQRMVRIDLMFKIIICMVFTNVLSMIDPCYPTGDSCTKEDDCPEDFKCKDDTPDPNNPDEMNGICVGNEKI